MGVRGQYVFLLTLDKGHFITGIRFCCILYCPSYFSPSVIGKLHVSAENRSLHNDVLNKILPSSSSQSIPISIQIILF